MHHVKLKRTIACSFIFASLIPISFSSVASSQAQATTTYIPADTTFDINQEGWGPTPGYAQCLLELTLTPCRMGALKLGWQAVGGDQQGFLRIDDDALGNDKAVANFSTSTAEWSSPAQPLATGQNEEVKTAKLVFSLKIEAVYKAGAPVTPPRENPDASYKISVVDQTTGATVIQKSGNATNAPYTVSPVALWTKYSYDVDPTLLNPGHSYQLRFSTLNVIPYDALLNYDLNTDLDNAKLAVTSGPKSNPDPTTTTPPPPPTDTTPTTPTTPPDDKREKPLPPTDQLGGSGDQFIEEPAGVPFDLSLKQCRIVNAYGVMQTITLPKKKAKVRIRRAASTMVTPTRNYSVWVQRKGKTKKKQIRRITYKVNNRQVKTDKRGRAIIGLKDLTPQTARKHRLSIRITQRRGKAKTINLTLTTKPCTVLMQASFDRAQLKLRVADWYPLRKVRFSLPKGMNVKKVKRKVNSAVKVKIGKTTYRLTSLGKGNYKAISKTLPTLRLKARGRTVTLTGLPANTRDVSLIFKRSQKIVRASWLTKKKRAETLLFKAYVTDSVATRRTDYRSYNTKKRVRK